MRTFPTRRAVLASIGASVAGFSGCLGDSQNQAEQELPDETETTTPLTDGRLEGFDTFSADWEVLNGSAQTDSGTAYRGDQSVFLDSDDSRRIDIRRTFDTPFDLSGLDFSMAVWIEETSRAGIAPRLTLRDENGNTRTFSGYLSHLAQERWHRLDMGLAEDDGPDMAAIREIEISQYVGDSKYARYYVDDIQTRPKPDRGYVVISFDDGTEYDYSLAYPTLDEFGYAGVCFPTLAALRRDSSPSTTEYLEMRDNGWDIGGHTVNHERLPDYSREEQRDILQQTRNELHEYGFEDGSKYFRTTYSAYDTHTLDLMSEIFEVSIIGQSSATGTCLEITDPTTVGFNGGDEYERAKEKIDISVEYNQLLGLTFHMGPDVDAEGFRDVIQYIHEYETRDDLQVVTLSELLDNYARS